MESPLIIVIGAYGSGKSEYAINLAKKYKEEGKQVQLIDLDVVNPYFRSRDVREAFTAIGIDVIAPLGQFSHADLPMLSPSIRGAIVNNGTTVIMDVGGDPAGCRVLSRFHKEIIDRGYDMRMVVNTRRPFTTNKAEILEMKDMMERTSHLNVNEFICNTNLMEYTTTEVVEEGINIIQEVADYTTLPFDHYLVLERYKEIVTQDLLGKKRMVLSYFLNKPWEILIAKGTI